METVVVPLERKHWWSRRKQLKEVTLYSYPALLYFWPPIIGGYLGAMLHWAGANDHMLAWLWLLTLVPSAIALAGDLSRNKAFAWLLVFICLCLSLYVLYLLGVPFDWLRRIFTHQPTFDPVEKLWISIVGTVFYLGMFIFVRIDDKWVVNSNQWEHHSWASVDNAISHGSKSVRYEIPDVIQFLLCGAGDIVIRSPDDKDEYRRIGNVPFVRGKWRKIDALMEVVRVNPSRVHVDDDEHH